MSFTSAFYKQLLSQPLSTPDVAALDQDLARGLAWLLQNPIGAAGLELTFWCVPGPWPGASQCILKVL